MDQLIKVSKNIVTQKVDNNILILENSGKHIILLNNTASEIFNLIGECNNISEIVSILQQRYNDETNSIIKDVENIIKYLLKKGIVEFV